MKTIHNLLIPIKNFDQWFTENFSWFFTNAHKSIMIQANLKVTEKIVLKNE